MLKDHPLQLERIAQDVSPATARTIGRMIAADPQIRFGSYDDVIDALEKAHEAVTNPSRGRVWQKTWVLTIAASLAAAAGVTWFLHRLTPATSSTGSAATTAINAAASSPERRSAFAEARRFVLTGRYPEAIAAFDRMAAEDKGRHPLYDWARLNEALAALLGKEPAQMRRALTEVENSSHIDFSDPGLAALLTETAKRGNTRSTIELADVPAQSDRSFPLLFLGLVDVDLGRFHDAATLLEASLQAMKSTKGEAKWAADYQPIAQKYLEDIRSFLAWRDQYAQAETATEIRAALEQVRQLTPRLAKGTALSREAALGERTLANQLGRGGDARNKRKEEGGQAQSRLLEQPKWDAARESFRRHAAIYDFAGARDAVASTQLNDPTLKEAQRQYVAVGEWLQEWKKNLISDLNARGWNGSVAVNGIDYSGIAGASEDRLRLRFPYGEAPVAWTQVSPATLLAAATSFARDPDRKWRSGIFAWITGQSTASDQLWNVACAAKASYRPSRSFLDQATP